MYFAFFGSFGKMFRIDINSFSRVVLTQSIKKTVFYKILANLVTCIWSSSSLLELVHTFLHDEQILYFIVFLHFEPHIKMCMNVVWRREAVGFACKHLSNLCFGSSDTRMCLDCKWTP